MENKENLLQKLKQEIQKKKNKCVCVRGEAAAAAKME